MNTKVIKRISGLLLTICFLGISACSKDGSGSSVSGLWLTDPETLSGEYWNTCKCCQAMYFTKSSVTTYGYVYSIKNPFKGSSSLEKLPYGDWYYGSDPTRTYGYVTDGNTIIFDDDVYTIEGGRMYCVTGSSKVFKKQ